MNAKYFLLVKQVRWTFSSLLKHFGSISSELICSYKTFNDVLAFALNTDKMSVPKQMRKRLDEKRIIMLAAKDKVICVAALALKNAHVVNVK